MHTTIDQFEQLKPLAHPLRLAILRRLMAQPATLSQLGAAFRQSPAHIRHHLKLLEQAGLVEFTSAPPLQNHLEKYYQAAASAWLIRMTLLPEAPASQTTLAIGSKDTATRQLADHFSQHNPGFALHILPLNSLDGLVMLQQGVCQMATCHLKSPGADDYNRSYIRHLFAGQAMALIRLFFRQEGLVVVAGNPLGLRGLADLARPDVRLVNREHGAGVRVWLDESLQRLGLDPHIIRGYDAAVHSHSAVAQAVLSGAADVGLGIAACARQAGLGFIPLFEEPYDLALPASLLADPRCAPFFEHLSSGSFRQEVRQIAGYTIPAAAGQIETLH